MITLNIINNLYNNDNFVNILTFSFISLVILFFVILFLAYKDKNKEKKVAQTNNNPVKAVNNKKKINNKIKEDITFEIPVISENLQQYKESIEESLQNDIIYREAKPLIQNIKIKTSKNVRVLDIDKIEQTFIEPKFNFDKVNENISRIGTSNNDMLPKKRQ